MYPNQGLNRQHFGAQNDTPTKSPSQAYANFFLVLINISVYSILCFSLWSVPVE